jgi:ankyrin repeat protein
MYPTSRRGVMFLFWTSGAAITLTLDVVVVAFLLLRGADPNKRGPGHFIPLVRAIDAVAQSTAKIHIIELLLQHGADTSLRDGSGRTAYEAANTAGLAAGEIKKLLSKELARRPSVASTASTASTVDTVNTLSTNSATTMSISTRSIRSGASRWKLRRQSEE